ncbi:hypothetical protein B0I35DRAFT_358190 [Stachybotrys elegans]|uniref:BTB domain-containing protein n=1 Tax=Stachybotrys elegans TaxID=80388 RepID=A0A8K0WMU9_9HYPO|nr:hypothetical protein B0I35DRAFT_358190 [Stachybotrys elegans]
MKPLRKKAKTHDERPSVLLSDYRTAWTVRNNEAGIDIRTLGGDVLNAHRQVLAQHSRYFEKCLQNQFKEGQEGVIDLDDINPKYLALYIGVAYSHSSIVPHAPPAPDPNPETSAPKSPLRDLVEVFKLCDRFISPAMGDFVLKCILINIGNNHRALYRSSSDEKQQQALMRDFADAFEALNRDQADQEKLAETMIKYFVEGIDFTAWDNFMGTVTDCPQFVAHVSRAFSRKLADILTSGRKYKRKELNAPPTG